jgi:hypothetical protein
MWVPKTAADLEAAVAGNTLPPESASYEYKQQLPPTGQNVDIAIDVSAMTVDGGVIIYGVGENKATASFFSAPIQLQTAVGRISQTVESNVKERPEFYARPLPIEGRPGVGYVVVEVPSSVRAPHMVEVKDEYRFYGRAPGGNRKLTQQDIDQLYERRRRVEEEGKRSLDEAIAKALLQSIPGERGDLHLVARPILSDRSLRQRVFEVDDGRELVQAILNATNSLRFVDPWSPDFSQTVSNSHPGRSMDGIVLDNSPFNSNGEIIQRYTSRLEFQDDGTTRYFRAELAEQYNPSRFPGETGDIYILREPAMAQICAHFIHMVGQLLARGGYNGQVDLYVALTGAKGAQSASWYMGRGYERYFIGLGVRPTLDTDDFRDQHRTNAAQMLTEPTVIVAALVARVARLIRPPELPDPLALRT